MIYHAKAKSYFIMIISMSTRLEFQNVCGGFDFILLAASSSLHKTNCELCLFFSQMNLYVGNSFSFNLLFLMVFWGWRNDLVALHNLASQKERLLCAKILSTKDMKNVFSSPLKYLSLFILLSCVPIQFMFICIALFTMHIVSKQLYRKCIQCIQCFNDTM